MAYNNNNNNNFYRNTFNNKINSDKDFSGEPILVYDSFYSESDDQEKEKSLNNKNNKNKNITKKKHKNKGTFYKITKQEKVERDKKKMDDDNNAMLQRVGSRRKTIVVQDESGKELSRIVSSTGNQDPNPFRRASFIAPTPSPMYPQPFMIQPPQQQPLYTQPQFIMQAPPPYQQPILVRAPAPQTVVLDQSYFTQRGSLMNEVIQEEPNKQSDKRVKSSIMNAINVSNSKKVTDTEAASEAKNKTKFKVFTFYTFFIQFNQ
jgi:hypothetical protein